MDKSRYRELRQCLALAQRNVDIAEQVLYNIDGAWLESAVCIDRAWRAVAGYTIAQSGAQGDQAETGTMPGPSLASEAQSELDLTALELPPGITTEKLSQELAILASATEKLLPDTELTRDLLLEHIALLRTTIRKQRKKLRRCYSGENTKRRWVFPLTAVCLLVAALGLACLLFCSKPQPWRMTVYNNEHTSGRPVHERYVRDIRYDWNNQAPFEGFRTDHYSVRFESCIKLSEDQQIEFILGSDDGSRLFLNGSQVAGMWRVQGYTETSVLKNLPTGVHHLRIDYFQGDGSSRVELKAKIDNGPLRAIPAKMLSRANPEKIGAPCGD